MIRHSCSGLKCATGIVAGAILGILPACNKPEHGPKREDHAIAHTPRYHPDVVRGRTSGSSSEAESTTRPTDFQFGQPAAGSPVLFVNGEAITVPEVLEPLYEDLSGRSRNLSVAAYRDYLIRRVVEQIGAQISRVMIYQEARKIYPEKANEAFAAEADKIIREIVTNRFGGVRARYEEHLKVVGLTIAESKEQIKRQLMVAQFLRERFKPLVQSPTRDELWRYYQEHKAEFAAAPRAEMHLIEIPLETELQKDPASATPEQVAAARERAGAQIRRAREELESGVPFADVARQYSQGLQAARGGAVGEISPGAMTQRYARPCEVLFTLEPGQISEPLETPDAVFLVMCGQKTPAHQASFVESQPRIVNRLMDEQFDELQRKYITELESRSTIHRRNEFILAVLSAAPRPSQFETAEAERPSTGG